MPGDPSRRILAGDDTWLLQWRLARGSGLPTTSFSASSSTLDAMRRSSDLKARPIPANEDTSIGRLPVLSPSGAILRLDTTILRRDVTRGHQIDFSILGPSSFRDLCLTIAIEYRVCV
ncbi:hypothetical protein G5I_09714 [Acromyrmex echinatior]|uniref:Uncharacterized protein n=1 Tax=Acromyrmex echinatior TaxID=103372 RepID=F4WUW2_ACREC|nr:hypothetical protein G5I_09714 [Acromyrmex echinatior]